MQVAIFYTFVGHRKVNHEINRNKRGYQALRQTKGA